MINKKFFLTSLIITFISIQPLTGSTEKNSGKIVPELLFRSEPQDPKYTISTARDFTLDHNRNIYIFDYMTNLINKYTHQGKRLLSFGKQGKGETDFKHLTAIKIEEKQLAALDSVAILFFSLEGKFISKQAFKDEVLCELPVMSRQKVFVGEQNVVNELKKVLTLRNFNGEELNRLTSYDLKEFFPELEKGKDFFLQDTYARFFLYDITGKGEIIWANSDQYRLYKYQNNKSVPFITKDAAPIPFPADQRKKMLDKQKSLREKMPMLHSYVPQYYPLLQNLFAANGEVWIYAASKERKGFVRYTPAGKEIGFYTLESDMDIRKARIKVFNKKLYFMVPQRKAFNVFTAPLPK